MAEQNSAPDRPASACSARPMHAAKPCTECPWRRDTPPGQFTAQRFEALRNTSGTRNEPGREHTTTPEAGLDAPLFACHKTAEGKEIACAGWLAVEGMDHLGIRLAVIQGRIPPQALSPQPDWPELFDTYDEMAAAQGRRHDSDVP